MRNMKNVLIICCAVLISIGAKAQTTEEIDFVQSIWGMEKKAIVADNMNLTDLENPVFWAAYDKYEEARKELGRERVEILKQYAEDYGTIKDEEAKDLINRGIANNIAIQKLVKKTFKSMAKSISPLKAAKFVQMENYFLTTIQMYILESIPFVDELDNMMIEK